MKRAEIRLENWLHEALTQKGRKENKSLNQTMVDILEKNILSTHIDKYIADTWHGELTRYCLIHANGKYAFVWSSTGTFPTEKGIVPCVNVELAEEGIQWFFTIEGARGAAAEVFAALQKQGESVDELCDLFA